MPPRPAPVPVAKPQPGPYTGMLALAALATLLGCGLLALELNEYEWVTQPPKGPALVVPVDAGPKPAAADGTAAAAPN